MSRKTYSGFSFLFMMLFLAISPTRVLAQVGTDVTSITTQTISTPATTVYNVTGASSPGASTYSSGPLTSCPPNPAPCVYTMIFGGDDEFITNLTFAGGKASVDKAIPARAYIRRNPVTDARQSVFYRGTLNLSTNTFNLRSFGPVSDVAMLNQNNILMVGVGNIFMNVLTCPGAVPPGTLLCPSGIGAGAGTIERVDFVLEQPVKAKKDVGFAVFDQGVPDNPTGAPAVRVHDGFAIAAITGVDKIGNPTSFGPIQTIPIGTWGKTPLVGAAPPFPEAHLLVNTAPAELIPGNPGLPINPLSPSPTNQTLGGVLIRADELLPSGEDIDIYGYSLFATDVTCTPAMLVDVNDACFPKNTPGGAGGGVGGLELTAANLGALHLSQGQSHDKDK